MSFYINGTEIITFADTGTVVNFENISAIIYTGSGNINTLFDSCKNPEPILICADNLSEIPKHNISMCIISGSDEAKEQMAETLKGKNIDYYVVGPKTLTVNFSREVFK